METLPRGDLLSACFTMHTCFCLNQDDYERVVAYGGKTYLKCQQNYAIEKERLATYLGILHIEFYLRTYTFELVTDCSALVSILAKQRELKGKFAPWTAELMAYKFRWAKKEQEQFRNTVSHASYLSEAANTNRLPLWAYGEGPVPGYFDKEDPRWGPLFELTHNQAIERVRCIQDIMEARAKELSQLYLGDMENLAYLVRAHPSMLKPLEMKLMAYANTTHRQKLTDHWQSLASAPSPTAVNVEIKRRVISSAGTDPSTSGRRPNQLNQPPPAAEKENQTDNRSGNCPNSHPASKSARESLALQCKTYLFRSRGI